MDSGHGQNDEVMKKIFSWLDRNLLGVLAGFLLIFIPLYPKWPLFDILPGYIVRVRLEDFIVLFTGFIFVIQFLRKRVIIARTPAVLGLVLYLAAGLASIVVAVFLTQTVPMDYRFVGKTVLHWLRRVEYFSLFFIVFSVIKSIKNIKLIMVITFITLIGVILYGYGQKYFYWPAFSTMNREFSKGWWLYLTEHGRVLSTFGGHYDLAGYLVITLTLCWSFLFGLKNLLAKISVGALLAAGFWLLILTASRISFISYLVGLTVVIFLWSFRRGVGWGISRLVSTIFLSILVMLLFGDLSDRFLRVLRLDERVSGIRQVLLRPTGTPPQNQAIFLENNLSAVALKSDVPPTRIKPSDVASDQNYWPSTQVSASGAATVVVGKRKYSQNALLFDLSTGIRLDATWPQAIKAFKAYPLFGQGYATLTQTSRLEFTEAESTDNDYLRALGETGILGFITFFGSVLVMVIIAFRSLGGIKDNFIFALVSGFIAITFGLLVNASYIDIFESSKVAYVFWGISGLCMGTIFLLRDKIKKDFEPFHLEIPIKKYLQNFKNFFVSDRFWILPVLALALVVRLYKFDGPIADWHSWRQADTSSVTRDFVRGGINWLYPTYDDLSSIASGKPNPQGFRFVEFPLYNAFSATIKRIIPEFSVEQAGRVTTISASILSAIFLFLISRKFLGRRVGHLVTLTYSLLPYSIYYGRSILPDPTMVTLSLGALWFGVNKKTFLSLIFASLAMLVKPYAIFLLAPLVYFNKKSLFYLGIAAIPLFLWRWWIGHYPEGVPASSWLFNGNGIRFKGAFWYWLFADRIGRLILGYWGLIPLAFGWIKSSGFVKIFLLSSLLYLFIFATGNVQHDYYQILLIPSISILVGLGLDYLLGLNKILAIVSFLFMIGFSWYHVRDYYNINHPEIVLAGKKLHDLTGKHEKALVIAPYDGDTAFLYQTGHKGWPIMEGNINDMIAKRANYFVSVKFDELTNTLLFNSETQEEIIKYPLRPRKPYLLLVKNNDYAIIQLTPDKLLPGN